MIIWQWGFDLLCRINYLFWGLQVEDVSFFETLGGVDNCEDYNLQKSEGIELSAELIKVPGSDCLAKAMKPSESNDELVPNNPQKSERHHGIDGISSQSENSTKVEFKNYVSLLLLSYVIWFYSVIPS